jgi:hypothetical protein
VITLAVGDTLIVNLPGKESPGYGWVLTPGDPHVVDVADGSVAGAFTLVARGPGTTHLVFAYRHPWENVTPIKTVALDIEVGRSATGWLTRHWWVMTGIGVGIAAGGILYTVTRKKKR